jgi:hypothetical protein
MKATFKFSAYLVCCLSLFSWIGCGGSAAPVHHKSASQREQEREHEDVLNEVRKGGLKDPGGARGVREEMDQQRLEQKKDMEEVNQQN